MRALNLAELRYVSGGSDETWGDIPGEETPTDKRAKGNNGFGNGANDGVPGKSGFEDLTR